MKDNNMAPATNGRASRLLVLNEQRRQRAPAPTSAHPVPRMTNNEEVLLINDLLQRKNALAKLFDPRRDLNDECGYPDSITPQQYRGMYDRELGKRVVNVYPEESWKQMPGILETTEPEDETEFEKAWAALDKKHHVLHYLQRIDELSGIGQFGILLIGLNDGKPLNEPVDSIDERGEAQTPPQGREIIYLRALDESLVEITACEEDRTNPRFGKPTKYSVTLDDNDGVDVHWSRVLHVADNRTTSEILGQPRQQPVWNRLYDLRKVLGGSGEMYWRGGFPGISLESHPNIENPKLDVEATREMMTAYMNGLQRYLAVTGMTAKSLAPQISDPAGTFDVQVKAICIIIGVPHRVFMGTEQGVLAGGQDSDAWDGRLVNRRERYLTPMVIDPFIELCVAYGVLPPPAEENGWAVKWPDAHTPSEKDRAEVAGKKTEAFAKYVAGGVDTLIPPLEYFTIICGMTKEDAEAILTAAIEHIEGIEDDDEIVPGRIPTPEALVPTEGGPEDSEFGDDEDEEGET